MTINKDYFIFAFNNLRHRQKRTWLTLLGIFIGIAAVISLISLSQGLGEAISKQFSDIGSDKITISASGLQYGPPGSYVVKPLTQKDLDAIKKINGIDIASGRLIRTAKIEFGDEVIYSYAVSLPYKEARKLVYETLNIETVKGRLLKDSDKYNALVGNKFLSDNEIFKKGLKTGDIIKINGKEFDVTGILKSLGTFQIDGAILIPEDEMREVFGIKNIYDILIVKIKPGTNIDSVTKDIERRLRIERNVEEGEEDFTVQTPQQLVATLSGILLIVQIILIGIASISLVVGGIGIMNTMYTSVLERTREIGVMKAIGAKNSDIFLLFFIESGLIGVVGGVIGVLIGLGFAKTVEIIAAVFLGPGILLSSISGWIIIGAILFSFIVGSISGVMPAIRASKLKPVEALRA